MLSQVGTIRRKALGKKGPEENNDEEIKRERGDVFMRRGGRFVHPTSDISPDARGGAMRWGGEEGAGRHAPGNSACPRVPPHSFFWVLGGLPDRYRLGLTRRAHQTRRDVELPGRAVSPCCGEGLASQVAEGLNAELDTMRVMGVSSQCHTSALH